MNNARKLVYGEGLSKMLIDVLYRGAHQWAFFYKTVPWNAAALIEQEHEPQQLAFYQHIKKGRVTLGGAYHIFRRGQKLAVIAMLGGNVSFYTVRS